MEERVEMLKKELDIVFKQNSSKIALKKLLKLTDEQIEKILLQCSTDCLPEIEITSDPKVFDNCIREGKINIEHSWAGHDITQISAISVLGDTEIGEKNFYQYYGNGTLTEQEQNEYPSEFSINQVQVVIVNSDCEDTLNDYESSGSRSVITIYVPEEKEYDVISYRKYLYQEKIKELLDIIKDRTAGRLTESELTSISSSFDLLDLFGSCDIEVEVTSDPKEFDSHIRAGKKIVQHSWAGHDITQTSTIVILGDTEVGEENFYQYSDNGNITDEEQNEQPSEFSMNQPQAVIVFSEYDDTLNDFYQEPNKTVITIYIPEEKEYDIVSYREMLEQNYEKKQRQEKIDKLSDLMKIDEEAGKLIQQAKDVINNRTATEFIQ